MCYAAEQTVINAVGTAGLGLHISRYLPTYTVSTIITSVDLSHDFLKAAVRAFVK